MPCIAMPYPYIHSVVPHLPLTISPSGVPPCPANPLPIQVGLPALVTSIGWRRERKVNPYGDKFQLKQLQKKRVENHFTLEVDMVLFFI